MKLKYPLLLIFFSCSFIFSQSSIHNSWITDLNENVNPKLTKQEVAFIKSAYGDQTFKKIISNKALEKNPCLPEALINLGAVYLEKNQFNKAEPLLKDALKIKPNDSKMDFCRSF